MQIIISPAKRMKIDTDSVETEALPLYLEDTKRLMEKMRSFHRGELQKLFAANEKITEENFERYAHMDLRKGLTPAILSYVGIQYQYMAPQVFTDAQWDYVKKHLWILSGFYGILRPHHGVTPYRLEMQAKLALNGHRNLYEFWGNKLYRALVEEDKTVINLASREYAKGVEPYLESDVRYLTCVFGSLQGDKIKVKGTEAKMARGEMVRWLSLNHIEEPETLRQFKELGFVYCPERSTEQEYVFLKSSPGKNLDEK
ncbi:MAG: peroxide stress protein YaaA [Lachnospiraceae bacterium]|jgi:cytoplasmic iron level regulating protein YaaA (DUF328/UPF0246 family)|nr:peroxide stress protein YaaA [Lachnospiraceae bacterium]